MKLFIKIFIFSFLLLVYKQVDAQFTLDGIVVTDVANCYGDASGTITVNVSGGQTPYEYSIDGGVTYQASNFFGGLTSGAYSVYAKDFFNQIDSDVAFIDQPVEIHITDEDYTDVTGCYGGTNGTITITASGGTGALEYSIDNGATFYSNAGIFTGLSGGTYNVVVRDANNCLKTGSEIIVGQPSELIITTETVTDIVGCPGSANGSIDIVVTGGTGAILYSIDNGATFQGSHYFYPLTPGNYQIIVKDSEGCTTIGSLVTVSEPSAVVIDDETFTNVTGCYNNDNGTITITASGGTGILSYSIDNGTNFTQNGGIFTNLFAGTYNIVVKDVNGCSTTGSEIIITQPPEIIIDSESNTDVIGCYGDETGTITINASGGSGTFEYAVNPGMVWQASNTIVNLPAGTYSTKVRDANDITCTVDGSSHIIYQPSLLLITEVNTTDVSTCYGGDDGMIQITTNGGGTLPYEFSINGGLDGYPHSFNITGLTAGIYDIIVQDSHNCRDTFNTNIVEIGQPPELIITNEVTTDPTCFGGDNGTIEVTASGGIGDLYYSPNGGSNFYSGNVLYGLSAGITYDIVVKDSHSCEVTGGSHILGQPTELLINSVTVNNVDTCYGSLTGSIIINDNGGGTLPISYSIDSEITYQASNTFTGLGASVNHIFIKDDNECKVDYGDVEITQPDPFLKVSSSFVDVVGCHGDNTGEINVVLTGGNPHPINGYLYSINGIGPAYGTGDFLNLTAGDYVIKAWDEYGCYVIFNTITISEPEELIPSLVSQKNLSCFGDNDGNLNLSATGGKFPYQYSKDNGITYQSGSFFTELTAGVYQTYVKDSYNCIRIGPEVTITQPDSLEVVSVSYTDITGCNGNDNGTITITASGGTPGYLYSINQGNHWFNNGGAFSGLSPGDYLIEVRDANLCEAVFLDLNLDLDTITLFEPTLLVVDSIHKENLSCFGDTDGTIDIYTSGGTGVIDYSIDNGLTYPNTTGNFTGLAAASYVVKVKDDNECVSNAHNIAIYEPPVLSITDVIVMDEICYGANNGTITIYGGGGTTPYNYSVDGINYFTESYIIDLAPGTYTPTLRDTNMCEVTAPDVEIGSPDFGSEFSIDVTEGCSPLTVHFDRLNEGTTYLWEFGDGETSSANEPVHVFNNTTGSTIDYTVTAYSISPNNCLDTVEMTITVYTQPQAAFDVNPKTLYYPDATVNFNNISTGYTTYLWDFGDEETSTNENPGSHTYETCGEYIISLYVQNSFTCSDSIADTIMVTTYQPQAFFEVDTTQHCTPFTFNFENQSTFIDTFEWVLDDGTIEYANEFSRFYDTPGDYTIKLDAFGYCETYDSYDTIITVHQSPIVDFDVLPDTVMLPNQPITCLNLSSDDSELFFWEFGDGGTSQYENPVYQYTAEGTYPIKLTVVSVNKCIDSLILLSEVVVLPEGKVLIPNAFTPNGDGENDVFKPAIFSSVKSFKMEIFNRWGEIVFYTEDINEGWTGYYDGQLSIQDVYVWRVEGKYTNGSPFEFAGSVTLIR